MATTATPPPAAPPASAPSSAPSSTPSTPATPSTPVTPAATPTPAPPSTAAAPPIVTDAPAITTDAAPSPTKPQPQQSDFPGDPEAFLNALHEWEHDNPDAVLGEVVEAPKVEEAKVEEKKPETDAEDKPWAPEPDNVTPEVVNGWADKNPLLKQVWEQSPEIKNAMFALARKNAELAPMGEIFPDVEAAQFANQTSGRYVDLRAAFTAAEDDPAAIEPAYEALATEFMVRDEKGEIVKDAEGNPTFTADFNHLNEHIGKGYLEHTLEKAEAIVKAGTGTPAQLEEANLTMQAIAHVNDWLSRQGKESEPDTSGLSPEAKAYFDRQKAEINAEKEKLGLQSKEQNAAQKKQEIANYHTGIDKQVGGLVGKRMDQLLADKEANGIFIPSYVLQAREPGEKVSTFAKTIIDGFNKKCDSVAKIKDHLAMLNRLPPSDANKQRIIDYRLRLVDQFVPGLFDAEVRKVRAKEISDRQRRQKGQQKREELATVEPQGGSARSPQLQSDTDVYNAAVAYVDKTFPDLDRGERQVKIFEERNRRLSTR